MFPATITAVQLLTLPSLLIKELLSYSTIPPNDITAIIVPNSYMLDFNGLGFLLGGGCKTSRQSYSCDAAHEFVTIQ